MKIQLDPRWSGADLYPLPYESVMSAVWRFARLNAMSPGFLAQTCTTRRSSAASCNTMSISLRGDFLSRMGWQLPCVTESRLLELGRCLPCYFLHTTFRFCPLCLEATYHSIWYQSPLLNTCPVHNCLLTQCCQSCGGRAGLYGLTEQLEAEPFHCLWCKRDLAGCENLLSIHHEFRQHSNELGERFIDLEDWLLSAVSTILPLNFSSCKKDITVANMVFDRSADNLVGHAVASQLVPYGPKKSSQPKFTILQWHIRMHTEHDARGSLGKRLWRKRIRTPTAVYRATIRILQNWLFSKSETVERELQLKETWEKAVERNSLEVREWDAFELAYVLFRASFGATLDLGVAACEVELADEPQAVAMTYSGRLPRIAYRAIYLAAFAGFYRMVMEARRRSGFRIKNPSSIPVANLVSCFDRVCEFDYIVGGGVFFRPVTGMPLAPFKMKQ